jgi:hypothetical protein
MRFARGTIPSYFFESKISANVSANVLLLVALVVIKYFLVNLIIFVLQFFR